MLKKIATLTKNPYKRRLNGIDILYKKADFYFALQKSIAILLAQSINDFLQLR